MQIKSLLTGLTLTAELKSDESDIRHFITVDCYEYDEFNNIKSNILEIINSCDMLINFEEEEDK